MRGYAFVRCYLCGATGEPVAYTTIDIESAKKKAVERWNRRFSE